MTEPSISFAGNLTDDPELRHTEGGIARAVFRVAVSGRREQEASFFTVVVWRDQAEHAAESLSRGSRVVVVGRLQQRAWTAEDGSARSVVEVVAEELGPSPRWATATTTRMARSQEMLANSTIDATSGGLVQSCGSPVLITSRPAAWRLATHLCWLFVGGNGMGRCHSGCCMTHLATAATSTGLLVSTSRTGPPRPSGSTPPSSVALSRASRM
jgi:single-strand DNA-binding protein